MKKSPTVRKTKKFAKPAKKNAIAASSSVWTATAVDVEGNDPKPHVLGIFGSETAAKAAVKKDMDLWLKANAADEDEAEDLTVDREAMSAYAAACGGREWNVEESAIL